MKASIYVLRNIYDSKQATRKEAFDEDNLLKERLKFKQAGFKN